MEKPIKSDELNFFSIKTGKKEWIEKLNDFYKEKNLDDIFQIGGLTQLHRHIKQNDLVFIVAGGDKANIGLEYTQGLYGVAKVEKAPYDKKGRSYKIDVKFIYFFEKVLPRNDFVSYEDMVNVPNIGVMTKSEQNQAISQMKTEQAKATIRALQDITKFDNKILFSLFPWVKDEYKSMADGNYKSLIDALPPALKVEKIAKVFAKYLVNYNSKDATTLIGIFGMWGRGKTYFFDKVKEYILTTNNKNRKFYFCKFQPWKYQEQEAAWAYLYETILESYLTKELNEKKWYTKWCIRLYRMCKLNFKRLGLIGLTFLIVFIAIIITFALFWQKLSLLKRLMGGTSIIGVVAIYIDKTYPFFTISSQIAKNIMDRYGKTNNYSNYLGFQNEIEKELSLLLQTYIDDNKKKLILFIDDLDRCNEKILIDIIDGLRLVLDNEEINSRLLVVTAVDERILKKAIEHKYLNQKLVADDIGIIEYIEKFFLMGIKLEQLSSSDVDELVETYTDKLSHGLNKDDNEVDENNNSQKASGKKEDTSSSGDVATEATSSNQSFSNNTLDEKPLVLQDEEVEHIKKVLKNAKLLTPRKINMFIHRYLIFKSLIIEILDYDKYEKFDPKMLIEFVVKSQNKEELEKLIEHYKNNTSPEINIPLDDFSAEKINREDYIILIKFAEMVTPF